MARLGVVEGERTRAVRAGEAAYLREKAQEFRNIAERRRNHVLWKPHEMADDFEVHANEIDQELSGSVAQIRLVRERLQTWRWNIVRGLHQTIAEAVSMTGAQMGNIQVFEAATGVLRIAASVGFGRDFLDFFAVVRNDYSAGGAALKRSEGVIVEDVNDRVRL